MLQAGIHQRQDLPDKSSADEGAAVKGPDASSEQPGAATGAAAASSPEPEPETETEATVADSQAKRSCIFEVEVVLTITGTKITPSISQFMVRHPCYGIGKVPKLEKWHWLELHCHGMSLRLHHSWCLH